MAETNTELLAEIIAVQLTKNEVRILKAFAEKILLTPYKSWFMDMTLEELKETIELL